MATRYEVVDYIKKNRPKFASSFKDDREIYEWARKRYLRNYPSWDEVEARFNIDTTDIVPGYGYINFNGTEKDLDIFCNQLIDEGEQTFKIIGIHKID